MDVDNGVDIAEGVDTAGWVEAKGEKLGQL